MVKGRVCHLYSSGLEGKKRSHYRQLKYSDVPSAIRPIPHGPELSVPELVAYMKYSSDSEHSDDCCSWG